MQYVIIGNSTAAVGCVEGIRKTDPKGGITLISDEPHHTYSRPLISYLLWGHTTEQLMKYRDDDFYEKNGVTPLLGKRAVAVSATNKEVRLDDGSIIPYDKLLIATGSRPFVPPMNGLDKVKKQFSFMTLDQAHALDKALTKKSRVLIVGAGLIGLKCAEGIFDKVASLTVVDLADRILPSILDSDGSSVVQKFLEDKGVAFHLSTSVEQFEAKSARLTNGETVDFDILVLAVGVRPNTELAKEIGAEVNRGVVIDAGSATTVPDVYAAGDCAESYDITCDANRVLALLPNAYLQGETAGVNMAGGKAAFTNAIPMNAIGFFGLHMVTAGSYTGEEILVEQTDTSYKKLFVQDDLLKGYIIIGNVERSGIYTSLIREKTPLSTIDFDLIVKKPQLAAFSLESRKQKLGGQK